MKVLRVGVLMWLVAASAVASSACDDPTPDIGVSLSDSGTIRILYNPCHETRKVRSVELSSGGEVIWRIESEQGSPLREFVAGEEPDGFTTTVPLTTDVLGVRLLVQVSDVGVYYFESGEIGVGKVLVVGGSNISAEEFWARDTCESGWLN